MTPCSRQGKTKDKSDSDVCDTSMIDTMSTSVIQGKKTEANPKEISFPFAFARV